MGEQATVARRRNFGIIFGVMLTFVGVTTYFTVFAQFPFARDFPWVNLPLIFLGCAISALAVWRAFALPQIYRGKILGPLGLAASVGLAGLFIYYIFVWSSALPGQSEAGAALKRLPDFALTDQHQRAVQSAELRGKKVVLTFFRGHW